MRDLGLALAFQRRPVPRLIAHPLLPSRAKTITGAPLAWPSTVIKESIAVRGELAELLEVLVQRQALDGGCIEKLAS